MTTQDSSTKGKTKKQRERVDVFADMMEAGAFGGEEGGEQGSFVEAFTSVVASPAALSSLGAKLAQEYGFRQSKEQSFDIPIERVLDSPYQQRLDKSQWTDKQRREYERLRTAVREGLNEVFFIAPYPGRPGYFFLAYGGHNRRDAAREEGYTTIPCIIVAYEQDNEQDEERVGFGTTFENEVKVPMTLEERGRLYRQLMQTFKLSQEKLARRLDLTRDIVKDCLLVAECAEDIRLLVRDLPEGSGVRIARALNRLERLGEVLGNEEAPRLARAPLIAAYRTGEMKTELIEAYIEEILRLVEEGGVTSIEETLNQLLHSSSAALEDSEPAAGDDRRTNGGTAPSAPTPRPIQATADGDTQRRGTPHAGAPATDTRSSPTPLSTPGVAGAAENAQRIDKLLKAQKYLVAYRRLAQGVAKGEQEMRILAEMDSDIQEERAQKASTR